MEPAYALAYHFTSLSQLVDEVGVEPTMPELQSGVLPFYDPSIEIGGCIVGINSTVSPTSDASTHYVGEPVLPRARTIYLRIKPFG